LALEGTFESVSPLAGLALLVADQRVHWVKSRPPAARSEVSFSAAGWEHRARSVSVTGSFHGASLPPVPVEIDEEPPAACVLGELATTVGTPHVVARLNGVAFVVVLLPASAIKVGRNRLWRLREDIAGRLHPEVKGLLTRGRSGQI
jgi:hypothetical protein